VTGFSCIAVARIDASKSPRPILSRRVLASGIFLWKNGLLSSKLRPAVHGLYW
jgi:hypothetical protein